MANPIYNVLQAKSAVATSSSNMSGFLPKLAIDGSGSTLSNPSRWVSANSTAGEWLQVDIGRLAVINKFVLYTGNSADNIINNGNSIQNGDFQIRQNGQWLTVGSFRNNNVMNPKIEVKLDKGYLTDAVRLYFPIAEGQYRVFELEAYGRILGKKAALPRSKKNLIPPLSDSKWFVKSGQTKGEIINDYEYKMTIGVVGVVGYDIPIKLEAGKTYTLGATVIGDGARMRLMRASDDSFLININPSSPIQTYTATITDYKIRIENNGQMGTYTTKDFFLYEGNIQNPVFEPYRGLPKIAKVTPKKNLIPRQNLIFGSWQGTPSTINMGSPYYYLIPYPIRLKAGTYTMSSRGDVNAALVNGASVFLGTNTNLPQQVVIPSEMDVYIHFRRKDNAAWGSFPTDTEELGIQLEAGSVATSYERYKGFNNSKKGKVDIVQQAISGSSHTATAGNVIDVKNNVKLKKSLISVVSTGSFNVAVYEWQDGKGIVGSPIYQKNTTLSTTGNTIYDFGGVVLKGGKKYWIGRYDSTGAAGVVRVVGGLDSPPRENFTLLGGSSFNDTSITYGTSYYYFFALEIEQVKAKAAVLNTPKKNFLTGFTKWIPEATAGMTYDVLTDRKAVINYNSTAQYVGLQSPVDYSILYQLRGKTVTFSAKAIDRFAQSNTQVQLRFWGGTGGNVDMVLSNTVLSSTKFVPADFTGFFCKIQTNIIGTTKISVEDLQLEIGGIPTPYEPFALKAKNAKY
jgi:hypothetical protein